MATRNIVPRANGEGSLGTSEKKWGSVYAGDATFSGTVTLVTPEATDDSTKPATTAYVKNQVASDTVAGMVELATPAEVLAGEDDERAVTPAGFKAALADCLQPSMTGSATLNGTTDNTVQLADIVTTLGLEVGDVIRIQYSGYDKLHTVESITNDNSVIVNYAHAGNRGNGSLKLADETATATITRIAKGYNAPVGLGQAWVGVAGSRAHNVTYTNTTGRPISVSITVTWTNNPFTVILVVDGVYVIRSSPYGSTGNFRTSVTAIVPGGSTYEAYLENSSLEIWTELR
jgi:hypothetical protein